MQWNENGDLLLYHLKYEKGKLRIQKGGYYYVYSKLSYSADGPTFIQTVKKITPRYMGDTITLLTHSRFSVKPSHKGNGRNSFLGGVFHLLKDDALFVHVNNGSLIRLHHSSDNCFGVFML